MIASSPVSSPPVTLTERDKRAVWHPFSPLEGMPPIVPVATAEGCYLVTPDGRRILDGISSWWTNLHGHSHPYLAEALAQQARTLEHVIFAGFTHEPAVRLAERLLAILPGEMNKIFYSDNGSTAVEVALKLALQYWHNQGTPKTRIVALEGAYHGDTFGAMAVGDRSAFTAPFAPLLFDVDFLPFPDDEAALGAAEAKLAAVAATGQVAAFIYEPLVQGAAGMRMYSPAALERLLTTAREHDLLLIADEVMTGFGRTGKIFASQHVSGQSPDLVCLSKGLTGGAMPLGVTAANDRIVQAFRTPDRFKTFFHGHSFTANPLACAVANASLDLLESPDCQERIARIAQQHRAFAATLQGHSSLRQVRYQGTILALELRTPEATGYFNQRRDWLYGWFLDRNVLLRPLGNVLYLLPPYAITQSELAAIYQLIETFLGEWES